jgi:hypothetical protein
MTPLRRLTQGTAVLAGGLLFFVASLSLLFGLLLVMIRGLEGSRFDLEPFDNSHEQCLYLSGSAKVGCRDRLKKKKGWDAARPYVVTSAATASSGLAVLFAASRLRQRESEDSREAHGIP